jgi:hypothetical protein
MHNGPLEGSFLSFMVSAWKIELRPGALERFPALFFFAYHMKKRVARENPCSHFVEPTSLCSSAGLAPLVLSVE